MKRLTKRIGEHVYYTNGKYDETIPAECEPHDVRKILQALSDYESTNHTPEECTAAFEELAAYRAAEQDGTLLRLPCKVGDTVYTIYDAEVEYGGKAVIEECTVSEISTHRLWIENNLKSFIHSDIGKTVFLTREAAEAALKEQEGQK